MASLDLTTTEEQAPDGRLCDVISEMCGTDDRVHALGSIGSFAYLPGSSELVIHCDSSYAAEQEAFIGHVTTHLSAHEGFDMSLVPDYDDLGYFKIMVETPLTSDDKHYLELYAKMHRAIRSMLFAYAKEWKRLVIASFHMNEFDGGDLLQDHVHILYRRGSTDVPNFMCDTVMGVAEGKCAWDVLDIALGTIEQPDFQDDDDAFDDVVFEAGYDSLDEIPDDIPDDI